MSAFSVGALGAGCASDQKATASAEEVRNGEALPPAPPVPAQPASTDSPTAPTVPAASAATNASPQADPAKTPLTEAQIAKLSELVNNAEVEQAKLAQRKAKAPAVRKFADKMVEHHSAALREQAKLAKKLNLTPQTSTTAEALRSDAEKTLGTLQKTEAAGFDAAYLQAQVDAHRKALELIDTEALPAAATPEVAAALRDARSMVEQHMKEAQALQAK